MEDLIATPLVAIFGFVLLLIVRRGRFTTQEENYLGIAYAAHVATAVILPWFTEHYMGGGDWIGYAVHGQQIRQYVMSDLGNGLSYIVKLFFQSDDVDLEGSGAAGTSTGSMSAVTAFIMLFVGGSAYGAGAVIAIGAFFGQMATYMVFREEFGNRYRVPLMLGTMLVPSVVCWSSGIIKEGVLMATLGWVLYGTRKLMKREWLGGIATIAVNATIIGMIKPYVLFPFVLAAAIWFYWGRAAGRSEVVVLRPLYMVLGLVVAFGAVSALGSIFPSYSIDHFAEQSARIQEAGLTSNGGSNFEIVDEGDTSLGGRLAYAPLALVACLLRPFIFEVRNPLMLISALETTTLLVLVVRAIRASSWKRIWRMAWRSPILMFSVVFTLLSGVAIGLSTTNLGTLSRYRLPLMPFYVALVLVACSREETQTETEPEEEARTVPAPMLRRRIMPR